MTTRPAVRFLFIVSLITPSVAVLAASGCLLFWPTWQRYRIAPSIRGALQNMINR